MKKYLLLLGLFIGLIIGAGVASPLAYNYGLTVRQKAAARQRHQVVEQLKQSANLVTTEVLVKKMAVYDSSSSESVSIVNPVSWRIGERMCVIPVEVTLKYGFDLTGLSAKNFTVSSDGLFLEVELPAPRLLDSGYSLLEDKSAYCYASSWGQSAGHKLREQIRQEAYQTVLKDDILKAVHHDVVQNGQLVFQSLLKSLGYQYVTVVVNNEKH